MARYLQSNINVLLCYYCYSLYKVVIYHAYDTVVNLELSERGLNLVLRVQPPEA